MVAKDHSAFFLFFGEDLWTNIGFSDIIKKDKSKRSSLKEKEKKKINCSPVRNGATAEIVRIVSESLSNTYHTKCICIDDYEFGFCKGCRTCHKTAKCIQNDDITDILNEFEWADIIVSVSPSYWADIPGQFKAF